MSSANPEEDYFSETVRSIVYKHLKKFYESCCFPLTVFFSVETGGESFGLSAGFGVAVFTGAGLVSDGTGLVSAGDSFGDGETCVFV